MSSTVTQDQSWKEDPEGGEPAVKGLVAVWTRSRPALHAIAIGASPVAIGREGAAALDDQKLSRRHVEISFDQTWRVRDLDSHNGTYVDGVRISGEREIAEPRVIRAGDTLLVPCDDIRPYRRGGVEIDNGLVIGPRLRAAYTAIALAARTGTMLHLSGESGSGKELAARRFHLDGPAAAGPFVAVNCAAIPVNLAESLFFGVKRGAFSGADADRDGYLASADGGTLFLDELGELSLEVQSKLLRVLESGEVLAVGATRPRKVELRLCTATHHELRTLVASGAFRQDLYYRIGRPMIAIPPIRDRPEELGYLALAAIAKISSKLVANPAFVEQLLMRPWPGNARELLGEVGDAAMRASATGGDTLAPNHLAVDAGMPIVAELPKLAAEIDQAAIAAALEKAGGNVSAAARALGLHRTQLRRLLGK